VDKQRSTYVTHFFVSFSRIVSTAGKCDTCTLQHNPFDSVW